MAKFRCDKQVKWRNTSSSPNSGNPGISSRSSADGIPPSIGRSCAGQSTALLPEEPLSKSSFGAATRDRLLACDGSDKLLDLLVFVHFSHTDQQTILQLRVPLSQLDARDDFLRRAPGKNIFQVICSNNKFIEVRPGKYRFELSLADQL